MRHKLLFVEDEPDLGNITAQYLGFMNFEVTWHDSAEIAYQTYRDLPGQFDLLLLDIQLPDYSGFDLAEKITKINPGQAFLFLTAKNDKKDRLQGLSIGADDYIIKPFDIDELVLRIRNILRRQLKSGDRQENLQAEDILIGDILFQKNLLQLNFTNNHTLTLTVREAELLEFLSQNPDRVLKREEILLQLWGDNDYFMGRSLDVFISRLRKALVHSKSISIDNVYGLGFIFNTRKGGNSR
ncbi:response regulator transcription factor [Desertivirga brevis]|uniref:response regulator transcription factor n=1 Tax=Desertivirga brevis TaxID=2810310 RepID=UPI001A97A250|nr:response regulator transcription factor [Pedobacter sp. SYSU D00873]